MRRSHLHPNGPRRRALRCEALEARHLLTTLVVENQLDGALADLAGDGELSLREAIEIANTGATIDGYTSADVADTIVFDPAAFTGGAASLIRLTAGELLITESLTIDGSQAEDLVISGDALGNDPLVPGTFLTHIDSWLEVAGTNQLGDNARIFNYQDDVGESVLLGLTMTGGRGNDGGAIRFDSNGSLLVQSVAIHGSFGGSEGGAILASGGSLAIDSSRISGNYTLFSGGGVQVEGGELLIIDSTLSHNVTASGGGGAVFARDSPLSVLSSTVSNNSSVSYAAYGSGGGVSHWGDEDLFIHSSTITGNESYSSAGVSIQPSRGFSGGSTGVIVSLAISDSIISGNVGGGWNDAMPSDLGGVLYSSATLSFTIDHSLIGDVSGFRPADLWTGEGNVFSTEPLLGPLADNGGLTYTHALLPGSPALDAGDPAYVGAAFDQRGEAYARVVGGRVDMGAYESQATPTRAPGDYNGDGLVDAADYTVWRDALGATGLAPLTGADGDGDSEVTDVDLSVWRSHYGFAFDPPPTPAAAETAFAFFNAEPERMEPSVRVREASAITSDPPADADALLLLPNAPHGEGRTTRQADDSAGGVLQRARTPDGLSRRTAFAEFGSEFE